MYEPTCLLPRKARVTERAILIARSQLYNSLCRIGDAFMDILPRLLKMQTPQGKTMKT
jgi:hypothetical protein